LSGRRQHGALRVTSDYRLTFVSPRFLFPADSGGKIRTTQILRGLRDSVFDVTLLMPLTERERIDFAPEIDSVCNRLVFWQPSNRDGLLGNVRRILQLANRYPVAVAEDKNRDGAATVKKALDENPDVAVFDFPHSAVLATQRIESPSVLFTHNIESEIFRRHLEVAASPAMKMIWRSQYRKMSRFEKRTLKRFDTVIAVSDRDCTFFERQWDIEQCRSIPTGVDTEFFTYVAPAEEPQVVFCGSMDWMANIDAIEFFHDRIWPLIRADVPKARMRVIGRSPPDNLVRRIGSKSADWQFTGYVDDVRDHVCGAAAFVIPLRVGGGTRIKAFEAMAMGTPVVSTTIGVEGLPIVDGQHYLNADEPAEFARSIVSLLEDRSRRLRISEAARDFVATEYGFRKAAQVFEQICLDTVKNRRNDVTKQL